MPPENGQNLEPNQEPVVTPPVPEPTPTPAPEPSPMDIVKDIQAKVDQMASDKQPPIVNAQMTPQQMRDAIKEKTGYTDEQVDFHFNSLAEAMAPMREQMSWMTMEKKFSDISALRADMEEELKAYPAPMRGDPVLMEKVYFMSKGKKMSNQPTPQPTPQRQPAPQPGGNVVSRRVANDYPGFSPSSDNSAGGGRQVQLSNEQRELSRRMGIKEEDYIEHMDRKPVRDFLTR